MHRAAKLISHGEADWEWESDRSDSVPNTRRTGQYSQGWNGNDARLTSEDVICIARRSAVAAWEKAEAAVEEVAGAKRRGVDSRGGGW